jgi:hypothetical protein
MSRWDSIYSCLLNLIMTGPGPRETKKVIARGEGYTYIADLRSPDLRHTTNEKETPLLLW